MANIRPNQLPPATEVTNNDLLILDQGAAGVNAATPKSVLDTFAPIATQSEAEAGQDNEKRMTPLRAQQHLLAQGVPNTRSVIAGEGLTGGGTLESDRTVALSSDSIASLELADSAVQPSREVNAGEGLAGGGDLTVNRAISLSPSSISSLGKADTALQAPGGLAGQILAKSTNADNDVSWVTSESATAVSYGPQYLSEIQKGQARANIGAGTFRWNWIINGDFSINQRGGAKKPDNGVYGFDRWKGHANGIEQIVEDLPSGEYTLTWSGGGIGYFGDSSGPSPLKVTISQGNQSVVVPENADRVSLVHGDATSEDDPFIPRHIQQEMALCQRYFENGQFFSRFDGRTVSPEFSMGGQAQFVGFKRAVPTVAITGQTLELSRPPSINSVTGYRISFEWGWLEGERTVTRKIWVNWSADAEL